VTLQSAPPPFKKNAPPAPSPLCVIIAAFALGARPLLAATDPALTPSSTTASGTALGSRWELLVDPWLVASARAVTLKLNAPRRAEIALVTDAP